MEYEEIKELLFECVGLSLHEAVVYLKYNGLSQDINGEMIAPLLAQAKAELEIEAE